MAFRKENKTKSNFSKISIGLASPEEILENSSGEVLKPEITVRTNPNAMVCSASAFLVLLRITNAIAVNISVSVIKVSSATVVV